MRSSRNILEPDLSCGMWDTFYKPDTVPFEREFFQRMFDIGFRGILGLDNVHLMINDEMKKWWKEFQEQG